MTDKAKNPPLLPREDDFVVKNLRLDQICYDGGTQMRTERKQETIDSYMEKYISGVPMPEPVVFHDGTDYWLADGFQRCEAATAAKLATLNFRVYAGGLREAVLYACGANESHGLRRDKYAKRRAALTCLLDSEWGQCSNRWIADTCHVVHGFVNGLRDKLEDAMRQEAAGGKPALEWAKEYCRNPHAKPGEAVWVPPWKAGPPRLGQQHSPPPGCEAQVDTYPVHSDDGDAHVLQDGAHAQSCAESDTEYRTSRDGKRRPARPKSTKDKPCEEAFDCYGDSDAPEDGESETQGTTAIGEPLNELTAPAFAQLAEFNELHRILTDVMRRVDVLYDTEAGCFIPYQQLNVGLQNCRGWIYGSRPHALHQECGGGGCRDCRFSGFITAERYKKQRKLTNRNDQAA